MPATNTDVLDVLIVGAGLSGIDTAYRLTERNPGLTYTIVEQRDQIGGTWDLFPYPGVRSDSDIFTLSFPGTRGRAPAPPPWATRSVSTCRTPPAISASTNTSTSGVTVVSADFDTSTDVWTVTTQVDGQEREYRARFLYVCAGYYRYDRGYEPDFPGIENFQGQVVHLQFWPEDLDHQGKKVVVIGSGATAVTLIPSMSPTSRRSPRCSARRRTWCRCREDPMTKAALRFLPDKPAHQLIRVRNALVTYGIYMYCRSFPKLSRRTLRRMAKLQLPKGYPSTSTSSPSTSRGTSACA